MVRLKESVSPLALEPPRSQKLVLAQLTDCPQADLLTHLHHFKGQSWEPCTAVHWHPLLNRFDDILANFVDPKATDPPTGQLVRKVLQVLYEVLFQYPELKGVFASGDRLRDLLECTDLLVVLSSLQCLSICPAGRQLRGVQGAAERRLEVLAGGMNWPDGLCAACTPDCQLQDFVYEVPQLSGEAAGLMVISVSASEVAGGPETIMAALLAKYEISEVYQAALRAQLCMWCHARTTEGRQEVVAISLYALCNAVKHLGPGFLRQHLQKRPGLFAELCDLLQNLQKIGHEAGVAALRATGAILDSRYGQNRTEMSQLSQMLGLSVPHGIVACALRALLSEEPSDLNNHYKVLLAALDLFQITTASNHQTTVQLGHAGMILAMLELMQKTDVKSLPAVVAMLRCLELAAEVSGTTALVLFREFRGLPAFSTRLQQEVDLLMALDFNGDVYDMEPPPEDVTDEERTRYWALLEEVSARRRLCRQLLKNIQVALQCSEVVQAGLANVFQGPLMDVLKKALQEPHKVGLCLFGTAIDIVSNLIQDDPSRVPQMIESGVLPGIVEALNKDTMRSVECLSFVPGVLGSISLHAVGEEFILGAASQPIKLLTEILIDPSFAALLHSQPELTQIMSTHVDKVLRNRPAGPTKLAEHVVDCILESMSALLEQASHYPAWDPTDPEDRTEFLADRLAAFGRFCWSVLGTNEQTLTLFLEKKGLALIRELHELTCLPYHLCSLEGQQHPLGSLFNVQAAGTNGNVTALAELESILKRHREHVMAFASEHLQTSADPYQVLASLEPAKVEAFLRALSGVSAALEGLVAVFREGASWVVLDCVLEPMLWLRDIAPMILTLSAWSPKDKDSKSAQTGTYTELARSVFTKPEKSDKDATGSVELPDATSKMMHVAKQCFRLSAHTLRHFLVVTSKQLHSRTRQREVTPSVLTLAHHLAVVSKCIVSNRPSDLTVALRWTGETFDLLLRLHEEQNRVAVRPLCLCTFYQAQCFSQLAPLLLFAAQNLDQEPAASALSSGLTYFEKVTSHKRFTNASQVNLLRAEDGLIPKDRLCRSVQGEALKCVLPVWRSGNFSKFPESAGQSLMKVWVHTLDGPRDIPARPPHRAASEPVQGAGLEELVAAADDGAAASAAADSHGEPGGDTASDPLQASIGTLVDMGFAREQVERGIRELGHVDIGTLIMWIVSNPESAEVTAAPGEESALAEATAPAVNSGETPTATHSSSPGLGQADESKLKPLTTEEFQAHVSDMLTDLLPLIITFGRQVHKAVPVVADTMAFLVALSTPLWESDPERPRVIQEGRNAEAVVKACLAELGDAMLLPPPDALACVAQVLAHLLHRRPQVVAAINETNVFELLTKLHRWSLMSIDFSVVPFARGYRMVCFSTVAPVPPGFGSPLMASPAWLTPVLVCTHQLLNLVDLVQRRDSKPPLSPDIQKNWVQGILHIIYAFPGMDSGLALACVQVLTRLCSVAHGAKAFLDYQPRLFLDATGNLRAPVESAGGLLMLLRLSRQASFPGLLQMIADFVMLLVEEGPTLQQRMETKILALFTARTLPFKELAKQLYPLLSRNPELFEEALKSVTQKVHGSPPDQLLLEPIPESERPRSKHRPPSTSAVPLTVILTLVSEACFSLEVQHQTTCHKIHEAATKKQEGSDEAPVTELAPAFPLALAPDSLLYVLDYLLTRVPGLSSLLLKPMPPMPAPVPLEGFSGPEFFVLDDSAFVPQKSMLLVMTRHLLPRFARLAELWLSQVDSLAPAQRATLQQLGVVNPVQRCLPHLGACLCAAAHHASEPRRCLVLEAVVALKSLAEGPRTSAKGPERGSYGAQVAAVCGLVARLLGAAAAAERRELKDASESAGQGSSEEGRAAEGSRAGSVVDMATPKRGRGKKDTGFFSGPGETEALRDSLVAVLSYTDLYRSESSVVATSVVKCLEFLSRWEAWKQEEHGAAGGPASELIVDDPIDTEDHQFGNVSFQQEEFEDGEVEGEDQDDVDDDEDVEDGDEGLDGGEELDPMDVPPDDNHDEDQVGDEEEEYDDEMEDDYADDGGDDMNGDVNAQNNLATILNNAIHVFDQQGLNPHNMTLRVDIDWGEAGVIHGVSRAGQLQQVRSRGRATVGGWSEPGDLDVPSDHPLLRREQHQQHHADQEGRLLQLIPSHGNIRQLFGGPEASRTNQGSRNNALNMDGFDEVLQEFSGRLRESVRTAQGDVAVTGESEAAGVSALVPPENAAPPGDSAAAEVGVQELEESQTVALTSVEGSVTADGVSEAPATVAESLTATDQAGVPTELEGSETLGLAGSEGSLAAEGASEAPAVAEQEEDADGTTQQLEERPVEAEPTPVEEISDPAAALDIVELARLAASLGCTQTEILEAAEIDASVVAALPEDMRSVAVMTTISQVNLDHLRKPTTGEGAAAVSSPSEIDAAVLEALPPDIREEVLREEAARREQERAAQRSPAAPPATQGGGEMDNASFIASLDPLLREEVLMTAPEELLQSLPAELVAEAQLIRDRAFTRIASRREPPLQPQMPQAGNSANRVVAVRVPAEGPWQHPHLQNMEQQLLLQPPAIRRPFGVAPPFVSRNQQGHAMGEEEVLVQLGLHHHFRLAVGNQQPRQLVLGPGQVAGASAGASGLSSFDSSDRHRLERLSEFDEGSKSRLPLPLAVIPSICRLLYLRQEVAVTPLTRLFFNLSLHPHTRNSVLGYFMVLLCQRPEAGSHADALPPPHLFEGLEGGRAPQVNPAEIQAVGSQRVLSLLAYLLRRIPQCGEFFASPWDPDKWPETMQASLAALWAKSAVKEQCFINLLLQLLTTKLFLSSSQHATWLLSILHSLLVQHQSQKTDAADSASTSQAPAPALSSQALPVEVRVDRQGESPVEVESPETAEQQSLARWSKITKDMHTILSQQSVLALCHFLCQASGYGVSGEGDTFQMASEILVALATSKTHLDMVRTELMRVLASLVTDIVSALSKCEVTTAEPSTMETRFLRVVRTLAEVFKEAAQTWPEQDMRIESFLQEAKVETLWRALDRTLERMSDTEVMATPAQRLLSLGVAPSAVRVEGSSGLSAATRATLSSSMQAAPPKPLLNRLLPLIEAFFVLHDGTKETEQEKSDKVKKAKREQDSETDTVEDASSSAVDGEAKTTQVFADVVEVSLVENSNFGLFCKQHRRPLNALVKQTPALLSKSFSPLLRHMATCLDFDNKRGYFRSQLRSRRLETRHDTIRLRVRRSEIFMDSYHQLRMRSGEEMRAKIQVQFQGEEGIDAGGVGKEWYTALAKEIFNPNYALFVQAGGKACTYHPNTMSYVNRDHLQFFQFIGRVIGKAIHDGQNLEAWFTRGFYKHMLGRKVIPADLEAFDPEYFSNLKWMLDHDITDIVELYFSAESDELGQQKIVDLKTNGRNLPVTNENKHEYIQLMSEHKMTNSVRQQIDAFLKGLHEIVPSELLSLFDDKELELLISGLPDIDIDDLKANTEYHNYSHTSEQVQWFWKVLSEFSQEQRAWFLQFATGTSRVPVEGFKGLIGMRGPQKFSIHKAFGADRLPSAHTCFNQLDLPDYPSEEVLRDKLVQAVREGHEGFGFA